MNGPNRGGFGCKHYRAALFEYDVHFPVIVAIQHCFVVAAAHLAIRCSAQSDLVAAVDVVSRWFKRGSKGRLPVDTADTEQTPQAAAAAVAIVVTAAAVVGVELETAAAVVLVAAAVAALSSLALPAWNCQSGSAGASVEPLLGTST